MVWKPTEVLRVAEVLKTSTRPLRIETNVGPALLKYCGNPQGRDALSAEFIAAELLDLLGYSTPDHALLRLAGFEMEAHGVEVLEGYAFLTRWERTAMTFSGSSELLARLSNVEMITKILVFDTWIKNLDRFVATPAGIAENLDNLLFVPDGSKVRMLIIDHSHAFTETTFEDGFPDDWWEDEDVCGMLPNFDMFVNETYLSEALFEILALSRPDLESIVDKVPADWGLSTTAKGRIVGGLISRASAMKNWLPEKLLVEPTLGFGEW